MKLIINTPAELLALKNKTGEIIIDGDFECSISIKPAFDVRKLYVRGDCVVGGNCDVRGEFFKIKSHLRTSCMLGIKFKKLICKAVVPTNLAPWDRAHWTDRFGIATSTGCWDEFVDRLAVAAPKLLKRKHWLPIEKLMLESSLGKYREVQP